MHVQSPSRVWLCDQMDCSPPSSSVHGILQARILDRVAISSSWASSQPRDGTHVSCTGKQILYLWALGAPEVALTEEISHSSGGWESKIRVWAREATQWGPSWFSDGCRGGQRALGLPHPLLRVCYQGDSTYMASNKPKFLPKAPLPNYHHSEN